MNTIAHRAPRMSRAKAFIGALFAALALAGAVQAAAPDSASAMRAGCARHWHAAWQAEADGYEYLAAFHYALAGVCENG